MATEKKYGIVYDHAEPHREVDGPYDTRELAVASYESQYGDALLVEMMEVGELVDDDKGHPHGAWAVGLVVETLRAGT